MTSNSPLAFISHPVASTMGFGVAVVGLMVTGRLLILRNCILWLK
ncbi:hypothetical protein [Nostoc sp. DedQUE09]|nr:hypothetical protein [Nostoc sp. DedQUE09]MDZ7952847.1 hypothetical protein [Nostoc sp. DedQUE09]